MRRNCNLELQLFPSPTYYNDDNNNENENGGEEFSGTDSDQSQQRRTVMEESTSNRVSPKQNQPLTIFYNGKICVCDVNEFQAKAILMLANRESDERAKTPRAALALAGQEPPSPTVHSAAAYSPNTALSMKKSLQMFLQKRKHRAQAMTPYHR